MTKNETGSPRLDYLDAAKGIAIIAMMMGHWKLHPVNVIVYSFHMPLFFFISGYTFHPKPWKKTLRDKSARLLLPYAATCAVTVSLYAVRYAALRFVRGGDGAVVSAAGKDVLGQIVTSLCGAGGFNAHLFNSAYTFRNVGPIWFLTALFFVILFLRALDKKAFALFYVLLIAYAGYRMQSVCILPMYVLSAMTALVFAYAGKQAAGFFDGKTPWITLGISCAVYAYCLLRFQGKFLEIAGNRYPNGIADFLQAFAGIVIVLCICRPLARYCKRLSGLLCFFGRNSLCVLCVHTVEKAFFPWHVIDALFPQTGHWWLVLLGVKTTIQLGMAAAAVLVMSKISLTNRIFRPALSR